MSDREGFNQTDLMSELIGVFSSRPYCCFFLCYDSYIFDMTLPLLFTTVLIFVCLMCMLVHAFSGVGIEGDALWPAHDFYP